MRIHKKILQTANITINEKPAVNGQPSESILLNVGDNAIRIKVTAKENDLKYYTCKF